MSNAMQNLCRPVQVPMVEKAVLMCLADGASDNGHVFMLVSTLMLFTCLAERTVRKAVASLAERGYVRLELRTGRSSVYWLIPEAIDAGILPEHRRQLTPARGAPPPAPHAGTPARGAPTPARGAPITMSEPCLNPHNPKTVCVSEKEEAFERVWKPYPRKTCKADALKVWLRLGGDDALANRMLAWIAVQQSGEQWQRGVVPHLRTVLHQRRFEDPLPGEAGSATGSASHNCVVCGAAATVLFESRRYCREHNAARL